ncbi:hypothetical protein CF165_13250 [Amycolatopsis vastitatis]|uniref:DUF1707 domain-containing protein n=1 Tax=Amycolatopsis vastitatis TaxID=1905142 RepID=A0A229TB55_9PSEU|nr:hypothetical protein CF165_13250 [Amycolatopsis vastitatis]
MAVVDYAVACGWLDQVRSEGLRQEVSEAAYHDLPAMVADLPAPRWDTVPATTPVGDLEREFAITLLDIAAEYDSLSGADRRWRTIFAARARTAADLLVLFLDIEPHLRPRRNDPALAAGLERLAFVQEALQARGSRRLTRAEFDSILERAASGESLDTLRAAWDGPRQTGRPDSRGGDHVVESGRSAVVAEPEYVLVVEPLEPDPVVVVEPVVVEPVEPEPVVVRPAVVAEPAVADPSALDVDRARVAKYLEQALAEERLGPGEHAARTVGVWSATTTRELAKLVVDLPLPANDPLSDRKPDPHSDDLITPAHRQVVLDRLNRAMAGGVLTLWEYETRLDVAVRARTFEELTPAITGLPSGW